MWKAMRALCVIKRAPALLCLLLALAAAAFADEAEILYRFAAGGVVNSGPVLEGGRVWFISDSKTLYIMTEEGRAIGKRAVNARRVPFIACDPYGRALIPEGASSILMVNKAGQEVWRKELGAVPAGPPAFGPDGRIYLVAGGQLRCLAPNGLGLWSRPLSAEYLALAGPGPGGGPLLALTDGSVLLYSPDGALLWQEGFQSQARQLAVLGRELLLAFADGSLRAFRPLDKGNGTVVASASKAGAEPGAAWPALGSPPEALAAGPDGYYALGSSGRLLALGPGGGELWRLETGPLPSGGSRLFAFKDRIVLASRNRVRSFGPEGALFRDLSIRNATGLPALTSAGAVLSGGSDWILYAYRFERSLEGLGRERPAILDRQAVKDAGKRALLWYPGGSSDDTVLSMLADIENSLKSGTIGEEVSEALLVASAVALGELEAPFGAGALTQGPSPRGALARARACEVLGALGFPAAVELLADVIRRDGDPAVQAAAASAVAAIGLDPGGKALDAFAAEAAKGRLDARTGRALIDAIEALYRAGGGLDNPSGALALLRIAGGASNSGDLRRRAEAALRRLSAPQ
jgi:outer membrane protein assembly factor BamB